MLQRLRPPRLFWRVLLPQLAMLLIGALVALLVVLSARAAPETRTYLLAGLTGALIGGLILAALVSAWLARRLARTFQAVAGALDHLGAESDPDLGDELQEDAAELSRTVTQVSRRLGARISRLEEDRQQLRTILSGMVEGVVALDAEQRVLFVNERATTLLELPDRPSVGRRFWEVVRQRPLLDVVRQALDQPEPSRAEISWNGSARSLTVHAARLPGHPPRGAVLVLHDTTELRRLERLRQDFVANVSHELKTPLSVIKACVETLLDGAVDDVEHRGPFLERIAQQSDRLHCLILDLLSLARIESGDAALDLQPVEIAPVVRACLERHHARAEAREQSLTITADSPPHAVVWGDEEAIDQILENLVDNAVKYTPPGGRIVVSWEVEPDRVALHVADSGIGIPEHDLPRIFERFYRVDKARSRELGGTGLGLAIVKHLAQAMHGSVQATSEVGKGTRFTLYLPRPNERESGQMNGAPARSVAAEKS